MKKHLFFVCPTDYLEPVINDYFNRENYYYTSLGNSIVFDYDTIYEIENLITKHDIREVSFVLSNDNSVIFDALGNQNFSEISGLDNLYCEVVKQKKRLETSWQIYNHQYLMLSYFLNKKVKELQFKLSDLLMDKIKISGKIYNSQEKVFTGIYFDLMKSEYLN